MRAKHRYIKRGFESQGIKFNNFFPNECIDGAIHARINPSVFLNNRFDSPLYRGNIGDVTRTRDMSLTLKCIDKTRYLLCRSIFVYDNDLKTVSGKFPRNRATDPPHTADGFQ